MYKSSLSIIPYKCDKSYRECNWPTGRQLADMELIDR